eukprot:7194174-Pyramimonas_sp.AAC.2
MVTTPSRVGTWGRCGSWLWAAPPARPPRTWARQPSGRAGAAGPPVAATEARPPGLSPASRGTPRGGGPARETAKRDPKSDQRLASPKK